MIQLLKKLPPLTRRGKLVRNLLLCALALLALPWVTDWPTGDSEEVYRRVERQALLSPSRVVRQVGEAFLTEGEDWITAGCVDRYSTSWKPFQKKIARINYVLPKGELTVVALPNATTDAGLVVAVTGLPEEVQSGLLEIAIDGEDLHGGRLPEETFRVTARREENWLFFEVRSHGSHGVRPNGANQWCVMENLWQEMTLGSGVPQYPYTLELYDASGAVVERSAARLPRSNRFLYSDFWD